MPTLWKMLKDRRPGSFSVRYAAGEVLLIVIGVLIALSASDWQTRRADRRAELAVLRELDSALEEDLAQLRVTVDRFEVVEKSAALILDFMRSAAPYYDSLDAHFGAVYGVSFRIRPNTAAYESLKAQGIRLISNESLRASITRVFEQTYARLEDSREAERIAHEDLRPYYQAHFRDLEFGESATPRDYRAVANDQTFENLVAFRMQIVRQNNLPTLRQSIDELSALREAIRSELGPSQP